MEIFVRNLGRHADGYWIAEVSAHGNPNATWLRVHRKYGSWMSDVGNPPILKQVHVGAAAELQRRVRKLEKKERQGA